MAVRFLFFSILLLQSYANAFEQPTFTGDILRRIEELEKRDKLHQDEINTLREQNSELMAETNMLRKENSVMAGEINILKTREGQQRSRVTSLEERERIVQDTLIGLKKKFEDEGPQTKLSDHIYKEIVSKIVNGDQGSNDNRKEGAHVPHSQDHDWTRRQIEQELPVAFFSTLANDSYHTGLHQPIAFDNAITNVGSAYHPSNGAFIAPVSGIYVFSTTILIRSQIAHFEFAVNGKFMSRMHANGNVETQTTSQTAVFRLNQGDDVTVRNDDVDKWVHGNHYCSFTGFLLTPYATNSQIIG